MSSIMSDEHAEKLGRMLNEGKPTKYCLQCGEKVKYFIRHKSIYEVTAEGVKTTCVPVVFTGDIGLCEVCSSNAFHNALVSIIKKLRKEIDE